MEVPRCLKHFIQKVMRGFYDIECVIIMDILLRKHIIKEDDLVDLLKFERKQLRTFLNKLRTDKFIKSKMRIETNVEGKAIKHTYWYINYRGFVMVVRYKLDHVMKKIEMEERNLTSRVLYQCDGCKKEFTDFHIKELLKDGMLFCSFCGETVSENKSNEPQADSRLMMAKFNETMKPLYMLLKEIEDLRLPNELLEPELDVAGLPGTSTVAPGNSVIKREGFERMPGNSYVNFNDQRNLTVKIENSTEAVVKEELVKKEQPSWMRESTVIETPMNQQVVNPVKAKQSKASTSSFAQLSNDGIETSKEILETLLLHEKHENGSASALLLDDGKDEDEPTFGRDVDEMISDEDEDDDTENQIPKVKVGEKYFGLADIDDDVIAQMDDSEKQNYIRLYQQMYSHYYE